MRPVSRVRVIQNIHKSNSFLLLEDRIQQVSPSTANSATGESYIVYSFDSPAISRASMRRVLEKKRNSGRVYSFDKETYWRYCWHTSPEGQLRLSIGCQTWSGLDLMGMRRWVNLPDAI